MPETHSPTIHTLDLNFMGRRGTIAAYLIPHRHGALLVECGPGSTQQTLASELLRHGYRPQEVTDVLLSHIHLDHAGAAGWLAQHGARIHVHTVGAPHMIQPEKLLVSARRIYGDQMDLLWGEFLPVPEQNIHPLTDGDVIEVGGVALRAVDTPGHAYHHMVYMLDDLCFSGDVGGVRLAGHKHIRVPMPPPELNLEKWRESLAKLKRETIRQIAPTHFGIHDDPQWHLDELERSLDEIEGWIQTEMSQNPELERLNADFYAWTEANSRRDGISAEVVQAYELANPSWMSPMGIQRYWQKRAAAR